MASPLSKAGIPLQVLGKSMSLARKESSLTLLQDSELPQVAQAIP